MLLTWRWNHQSVAASLNGLAGQRDTYQCLVEQGAQLHQVYQRTVVGSGEAAFRSASSALISLDMHRQAGLRVACSTPSMVIGSELVLGYSIGPLQLLAPCRVSETWDSPSAVGFGYLTLPGHPERGYEKFLVERAASGEVSLTISARSRPGIAPFWPVTAVSRLVQRRITDRYQRALRSIVEPGRP